MGGWYGPSRDMPRPRRAASSTAEEEEEEEEVGGGGWGEDGKE